MPSKKSSSKGILRPTITLCLICALVTAALAGTNAVTKDKIAELQAANQGEAMARVLSADEYQEKTGELDGQQITYYVAQKSGKVAGAVYITAAKGYGGDVSVMTAVTPDGTVAAVEILSAADETPGLGQNATNPAFAEQFTGKSGQLGVVKTGAGKTEINALTGATITSKAVVQAVNDALRLHEKEGIS